MGPSGSGKTSLLQVLHGAAKHTRGGVLQGSVLINGTPCRNIHHAFRQMCSLVPQEDILLPELTVNETLMFAAELRLPQSDTREEREETVENVMLELGLKECRDVRIGSVEKVGISGGQRRRVSIGLELLMDPSLLLLDEPTSGLVRTFFFVCVCCGLGAWRRWGLVAGSGGGSRLAWSYYRIRVCCCWMSQFWFGNVLFLSVVSISVSSIALSYHLFPSLPPSLPPSLSHRTPKPQRTFVSCYSHWQGRTAVSSPPSTNPATKYSWAASIVSCFWSRGK